MTAAPRKLSASIPTPPPYTKCKPRVRDYMIEHQAAGSERLVDQEAEGLPKLNPSRDQILARLWELATLSHEVTRGIIAGQIKALAMIVAIEGLIPSGMNARRLSPSAAQPAAPPVNADIYTSEWLRKQQHQAAGEEPGDPIADTEAQPAAPQVPETEPAPEPKPKLANNVPPPAPDCDLDRNHDRNQPSLAGSLIPQGSNWVPGATNSGYDAVLDTTSALRQPFSVKRSPFGRRR
jgi:hypothetical protein